jgi:hypothetical protein
MLKSDKKSIIIIKRECFRLNEFVGILVFKKKLRMKNGKKDSPHN